MTSYVDKHERSVEIVSDILDKAYIWLHLRRVYLPNPSKKHESK